MKKIYIIIIITAILLVVSVVLLKKFNIIKTVSIMDKQLKHFNMSEFDSPSQATDTGEKYSKNGKSYLTNSGQDKMDMTFVKQLDNARALIEKEWNLPNPAQRIIFRINSGYRTQGYNDTLSGSVPNSSHIIGKASDISMKGYTDEQIEVILNALGRVGLNRFGMATTYIHVDSDKAKTNPAVWNYGAGSISIDPFSV